MLSWTSNYSISIELIKLSAQSLHMCFYVNIGLLYKELNCLNLFQWNDIGRKLSYKQERGLAF